MSLNPQPYLERIYKEADRMKFDPKKSSWKEWKQKARKIFKKDLGSFPEPAPLQPQIKKEKEFEEYTRQKVIYTGTADLDINAYVLIPHHNQQQYPAVVALHGHGYGNKAVVGLNPDGTENKGDPDYQKNFALELAKKGFLVIAPELLAFGERRLEEDREDEPGKSSCHKLSIYLLMMGQTMSGLRVFDTVRTLDYLETRKEVDSSRLGCMGISGGGLVCAFTSALEDRVKAAVISGYTNTFKKSVLAINHCVDNFVPDLVSHLEMPEIISLIAPRPLLVEGGTEDPIFPIEGTKTAYSRLNEIYQYLGTKNRLEKDFFEGEHQISGRKAYDWLEKWLKK